MQTVFKEKEQHYLRFDPGEEVISGLRSYFRDQKLRAASFTAIGAVKTVTLAFYDLKKKSYLDRDVDKELEMTSVVGNIGIRDEDIVVHAHGNFSDRNFQVYGGHIKEMIVSATCEVVLTTKNTVLERDMDDELGLPTWGRKA